VDVAKDLLGQILVRRFEDGRVFSGAIVEVEAYTADDPACHAFGGKKQRCEVMFGPPGFAYVYFIYGIYHCLNVVTESDGIAGAVLIRAIDDGALGRNQSKTDGPGKLCRYLEIDRTLNGIPLFDAKQVLCIKTGRKIENKDIEVTTRIGITKAADRLWRFHVKDNHSVSRRTTYSKRP